VKGEISLLIAGAPPQSTRPSEKSPEPPEKPGAAVLRLLEAGWDRKEALRRVAKEWGLSRRQVYNDLLRAQRDAGSDGEKR
jgi:16S rRNA (cytidine1402-2'-O)-methyltransferase